ncbi:hypothetical protein BRAS3843_520221 [Bradyrhizobium sp. STM 3843]|nr:hypothetical protein BRAS3843_520221 [Bradyrhizobium sp. STM 3843]
MCSPRSTGWGGSRANSNFTVDAIETVGGSIPPRHRDFYPSKVGGSVPDLTPDDALWHTVTGLRRLSPG